MSLLLATLIPGIFLVALGLALALANAPAGAALKSFPRSPSAAAIFFGGGSIWFLANVWNLSPADFGDYHLPLFVAFGLIAVLAFKSVPDFLAVRGVCLLVFLAASPLLGAAYMEYDHPQRLFLVTFVYICIALSIWLAVQPWRVRDFIAWLLARPGRGRGFGVLLAAYGILLCGLAFTY
jgi:hypothetical protein